MRAASALGHVAVKIDFRASRRGSGSRRKPCPTWTRSSSAPCRRGRSSRWSSAWTCCSASRRAACRSSTRRAASEACVDKYLTTARLAEAGLPVPRRSCARRPTGALEAFAALGGDVVVKPLFGSEGLGMVAHRRCRAGLAHVPHAGTYRRGPVPPTDDPPPGLGSPRLRAGRPGPGRHQAPRQRRLADQRGSGRGRRDDDHRPRRGGVGAAVRRGAGGGRVGGRSCCGDPATSGTSSRSTRCPGWRALAPATGVDVAAAMVSHLAGRVGR